MKIRLNDLSCKMYYAALAIVIVATYFLLKALLMCCFQWIAASGWVCARIFAGYF